MSQISNPSATIWSGIAQADEDARNFYNSIGKRPTPQEGSESSEDQSITLNREIAQTRPWRHTIGRISCIVRIPLYALGFLIQVAKVAVKIVPAIPITLFANKNKMLENWTIDKVASDAGFAGMFLDKLGASVLGVLFAPPKEYNSYSYANFFFLAFAIQGKNYEMLGPKYMQAENISERVSNVMHLPLIRISYLKSIFQTDKPYDQTFEFQVDYWDTFEELKTDHPNFKAPVRFA